MKNQNHITFCPGVLEDTQAAALSLCSTPAINRRSRGRRDTGQPVRSKIDRFPDTYGQP